MLENCPYWGGGCELFKDINNCAILASCWQSFSVSLARNSSNLRFLSAFSFNWHSNLLPCAVIEGFIPCAIAEEPCVVDLIFSDLCGGLSIFDFFRNDGLSACLTFACLSSASMSFKSVPSDLLKLAGSLSSSSSFSAALDTKFNGLCISAKTGYKIWYQ